MDLLQHVCTARPSNHAGELEDLPYSWLRQLSPGDVGVIQYAIQLP